ncbi:serine/threonine-protein phosphatase 4 regulatory subunit 1-like isoform X2 [Schistocerca gregaria]|uniref:serine/threonine-protein phosphatase 4 regulatory subunit 1-like isoform X2 n=1 Tax=Schistocerca gregaria TaxID=7010 RepID=UPI00211EBAF1|nr:serine/threonine-protein phosphatase 4 regulatory subunit 1-like isoform X2 [Schistocerca gregaria]
MFWARRAATDVICPDYSSFTEDEQEEDDSLDSDGEDAKSSRILIRIRTIRQLVDTTRYVGYEKSMRSIVPLLGMLKNDEEFVVREMLTREIVKLAEYLCSIEEKEQGYFCLLHELLPIVIEYATDLNSHVRTTATDSLVKLSSLLVSSDVEMYILPIVQSLIRDMTTDAYRIQGAQFLGGLSTVIQGDLLRDFIFSHFVLLANDPVTLVRKSVSLYIGDMCRIANTDALREKVFSIFLKFTKDKFWTIRREAVKSLPAVSKCVSHQRRAEVLVPVFCELSRDQSYWVCSAAYEVLVGPDRWNEVDQLYASLVSSRQQVVRRSLASSLHEIARILGTKVAEEHLLRVFEEFLKDNEICSVLLANISKFFAVLTEEKRLHYLDMLEGYFKSADWRVRRVMAEQFGALASQYALHVIEKRFVPLFFVCVNDPVNAVRLTIIGSFCAVFRLLTESSMVLHGFMSQICELSVSRHFYIRQLFSSICGIAIEEVDAETYRSELLPRLLALATDRVPNVRLTVAQSVNKVLEHFEVDSSILEVHSQLASDCDPDVAFYATGMLPRRVLTRLNCQEELELSSSLSVESDVESFSLKE